METTTRISYLENKARKGYYIYIKTKNKPSRYYKYDEKTPIDAYVEYYKDKYDTRRRIKGKLIDYKDSYSKKRNINIPTNLKRQVSAYVRKVGKRPVIDKHFKNGISDIIIKDMLNENSSSIEKHYKELFNNIVLDDMLLDLLVKDNNIRKIKKRLEHRIVLINNDGEEVGEMNVIGKKTTLQVMNDIQNKLRKRMRIEPNSPTIQKIMENLGYKFYASQNEGFLNRVKVHVIFRKAK